MLTLGIAGHVDHGKTSLVRALTGIETDRLPEEQRRGISIELGFAWLDVDLGGGPTERLALVDMPGHERFVKRMIAGAAGLDAVLLVVAADEGVMPQGREHLAICRLLGVRKGAVILTKADLVDAELLAMVREDVAGLLQGTFLQDAPMWTVSVRDPASIDQLRQSLGGFAAQLLAERQTGLQERPFRLSVDRSFSAHGRGTVVTGTAVAGEVAVEQPLQVLPGEKTFRVRGLEQQGEPRFSVRAPGRLAVNLAGATVDEVPVGSMLVTQGSVLVGDRFDATLALLEHRPPLPAVAHATLHLGTAQAEGRIVQLSGQPQEPGTEALVQVHLSQALPLPPGEAFVARSSHVDPRFGQTFAGGRILHPAPRRHRLGDPEALRALEGLRSAKLEDQVLSLVELAGIRGLAEPELEHLAPASGAAIAKVVKTLLGATRLRRAGTPTRLYSPAAMSALEEKMLTIVREFHRATPTRPGVEPDLLHRRLGAWLDPTATAQITAQLVRRGALAQRGTLLALPDFQPKATARPETLAAVQLTLAEQGLATSTPAALAEQLGIDVREIGAALHALQAEGQLVRLSEDLYVTRDAARAAIDRVVEAFWQREAFSTGELKDLLGLTRKHLIPFAEHLDAERVTVRDPAGNRRVREKVREAWLARQKPVG